MASIGELPYAESWGPHPNLNSEKKMNLPPVFTSFKQRRKRKFKVVFVQVVKKRALDVQNLFLFFFFPFSFWAHCRRRRRRRRRRLRRSLLPGFTDVLKRLESEQAFNYKACHLFTRYICYSRFGPLRNYFVCLEIDIWVLFSKKYIFQRNNQS